MIAQIGPCLRKSAVYRKFAEFLRCLFWTADCMSCVQQTTRIEKSWVLHLTPKETFGTHAKVAFTAY